MQRPKSFSVKKKKHAKLDLAWKQRLHDDHKALSGAELILQLDHFQTSLHLLYKPTRKKGIKENLKTCVKKCKPT